MLSTMNYVTSSGVVANGSYQLLAGSTTENWAPNSVWIDKPDDVTVRLYGAPSGVVADNDNTFLTVTNTNAAMVYFPDLGVSGVSFEVAGYTAGTVNISLFYQQNT